jgi:hypothetical protein
MLLAEVFWIRSRRFIYSRPFSVTSSKHVISIFRPGMVFIGVGTPPEKVKPSSSCTVYYAWLSISKLISGVVSGSLSCQHQGYLHPARCRLGAPYSITPAPTSLYQRP